MSEKLDDVECDRRIQAAMRCRERLLPLAVLIADLSSSKLTLESADKIRQANELLKSLSDVLRDVRDNLDRDNGPVVKVKGQSSYGAFRYFENGFYKAAKHVIQMKQGLQRSSDFNWQWSEKHATQFRMAIRDFSDFLNVMEQLGKLDVVPSVSIADMAFSETSGESQSVNDWEVAISFLTSGQKQIAHAIKESAVGLDYDQLTHLVDRDSEDPRDAVRKQISKIIDTWRKERCQYRIERDGRRPVRCRVKKSD